MGDVVIARALHVLGVVFWIGGVSMVTMVILPALRRGQLGQDWLSAFEVIEHRFSGLARTAIAIVGLSGFYMCWRLDLWDRFRDARFWWMHAMLAVWLTFVLLLFALEPLFLRRHFQKLARIEPARAFARLHRAHWLLLALSGLTIAGVVMGSQGW